MLVNKTLSVTSCTFYNFNIELKKLHQSATTSRDHIQQTHLPPEVVPKILKSAKVIYVYRNPKDVAWSFYNFNKAALKYEGTFEDYLECFLDGKDAYGSWFEHTLKWEEFAKDKNICVVSYEDMWENPIDSLRCVADYLHIHVDEEFLVSVHKACHIDNMRSKETHIDGREMKSIVRKGGVGGWKNHFTVALSETFDRLFKEKMETCRFQFKFDSHV